MKRIKEMLMKRIKEMLMMVFIMLLVGFVAGTASASSVGWKIHPLSTNPLTMTWCEVSNHSPHDSSVVINVLSFENNNDGVTFAPICVAAQNSPRKRETVTYYFERKSIYKGYSSTGIALATDGGLLSLSATGAGWYAIKLSVVGKGITQENTSVSCFQADPSGAKRMVSVEYVSGSSGDCQSGVITPTPCTYGLSSTSASVPLTAGTGNITVTAGSGCLWTASSNVSWITVTSGASGTGNGTLNYSVEANAGATRTGTITIGGQPFTVTQRGTAQVLCNRCSFVN